MKLLPNEEKIVSSNSDKIILTNYRIQMVDKGAGEVFTASIFLENISSIDRRYANNKIFIVLGIVSLIVCVCTVKTQGMEAITLICGGIGLSSLVAWLLSRKHIISISSNAGSAIKFEVEGMSNEKAEDFIYQVSLAKHKRVNELQNAGAQLFS